MREVPANLQEFGVRDIVAIDTEYISRLGELVQPVCLVAKSLLDGGNDWRVFFEGDTRQYSCPLPLSQETLYISYSAPAEWSCFLALDWGLPPTIIDLYAEETMLCYTDRNRNEEEKFVQPSLLNTMTKYRLDAISHAEKKEMRDLILGGGPWSERDKIRILDYCTEDVLALEKLFPVMLPRLNAQDALIRGGYTRAVASVEANGIPMGVPAYKSLKQNWPAIRNGLAEEVESVHGYGVYRPDPKTGVMKFSQDGFEKMIFRLGLEKVWPKTKPKKNEKTGKTSPPKFRRADPKRGSEEGKVFKRMAQICPTIEPLRVAYNTLDELKSFDLPVGHDGRCRTDPRPWASKTGRNQPRKGFIFALPAWTRNLIQPPEGRALAYVDLVSAEFGIAAALSQDEKMIAAYRKCGVECPYIGLAKLADAVPKDATKKSHPEERALYKTAMLAAQYGQDYRGFSRNAGISEQRAKCVHETLRKAYPQYWTWIDRQVIRAGIAGEMSTPLGWKTSVTRQTKDNLLMDFPMQGSCADILRVATTLMLDEGVALCAMVHDAVLIEDTVENIESTVEVVKGCWKKASAFVLYGFELDADAKIFRHPEVFKEGEEMWGRILELNRKAEEKSKPPLLPAEEF